MIWASRRDYLAGYTTSLLGMPSSLVGYLRVLLVWSSIQMPVKYVMLMILGENNHRNMSA